MEYNEIYTDLEKTPKINILTFKGKQYELFKITDPTFYIIQAEPYIDMGYMQYPFDANGVVCYRYNAISIDGAYYGFKLIEHE